MTLGTASLLVEGNGLAIAVVRNGSSLAQFGGGDANLAAGVGQILNNAENRLAVVQYANIAGGSDVGGVLVRKVNADGTPGAVTTVEGSRMQFMERVIFEDDHTAINTGTVLLNIKLLWKILGYGSPEEYLFASREQKRERVAHYMNHVWQRSYVLRMRQEEKVGERHQWPIIQSEVVLQWVLEWAQEQENLGLEAVKYQEVSAEVAYQDPKTRQQLADMVGRSNPNEGRPIQTKLPPGEVEDVHVTVADQLVYAGHYMQNGLLPQAAQALALARRSVQDGMLPETENNILLAQIAAQEEGLRIQERARLQGALPQTTQEQEALLFSYMDVMENPDFNIYAAVGLEKEPEGIRPPGELEKIKNSMSEMLGALRAAIDVAEGLLQKQVLPLMGAIRTIAARAHMSDSLLLAVASRMVLTDDIEGTLHYFRFLEDQLTNAQRGHIRSVMPRVPADGPLNPLRLASLRAELIAIYDRINDAFLEAEGRIKAFRTSGHLARIFSDKDATLDDPATPLKQSPVIREDIVVNPGRAQQLIQFALRGAKIDIPTGSTTLEGWLQVLDIIERTLIKMDLPDFMKKVAAQRIRVLSNDASVRLTITMDGRVVPYSMEYSQRFRSNRWFDAKTLVRTHGNRRENKASRLVLWNSMMRSFLKNFFNEDLPRKMLISTMPGTTYEDGIKDLFYFIDQLEVREEDIADFMTPQAQANLLDIQEGFSKVLRRMLVNYDAKYPADGKWRQRFREIFETNVEEISGDLNARQPYKTKRGKGISVEAKTGGKRQLNDTEFLFMAMELMLTKESAGTYGSITADHLEHARDKDDRLAAMGEIVINRLFWIGVRQQVRRDFDMARAEGIFLDQNGNPIPSSEREGPGYLNMVFGGVSKINFISGMLQDWRTRGEVVMAIGDSLKDQGDNPYLLYHHITRNLSGPVGHLKQALIQRAKKSLSDKISVAWDESFHSGTVFFRGGNDQGRT
ncbi:MAG: hypothetical protein HY591_02860 [Candidatus Omnitrophica bacterium]|nr:hypothetical protein [Candidatus Omnitrophota bacterium]